LFARGAKLIERSDDGGKREARQEGSDGEEERLGMDTIDPAGGQQP